MSTRTLPASVAARRARIAAVVAEQPIASQEELGRVLADEGVQVTQATLSRDLDALGAVKMTTPEGVTRYSVAGQQEWDTSLPAHGNVQLAHIVAETLLRAEAAQNIAVVHTPPGAAQYLAGHVDRSGLFDAVGTVAGDDTIIIVMRTAKDASALCATLLDLSEKG